MIFDKSQFQAVLCCSLIGDKDKHVVKLVKLQSKQENVWDIGFLV